MQGHVNTAALTPLELDAWRGFLHAHAVLVRELGRELEERHALALHAYEVLLVLDEAPHGRLRMSELAGAVLLSQSGVTRLVDRLERERLVARERCDDDRRGLWARITDAGRAKLEEARPTHLDGVRRRFVARFGDDELRTLALAWERLLPPGTDPGAAAGPPGI